MLRRFILLSLSVLLVHAGAAFASLSDKAQMDKILKSETQPFGVVFEVIESNADELDWVFPRIQKYAESLRQRFPEVGIAVVSHGKEEFGLLKESQNKRKKVHKLVKSLVKDQNITVHVCGTHASWYDKKPEDFPDYINVSPAGPTEIENYMDMGYVHVVIQK